MTHVRAELNQPERRVCRVLGQARSTQRYRAVPRDGDEHLVRRMHELVRRHPRRGYRMVWGTLRLEGWRVNIKRVHRLWKREGFRVPGKQHKRTRLGHSENGIVRRRAEHKDHVWCVDFIHDRDDRDRPLKWLSVVDEYTRACVALEVDRGMTAAGACQSNPPSRGRTPDPTISRRSKVSYEWVQSIAASIVKPERHASTSVSISTSVMGVESVAEPELMRMMSRSKRCVSKALSRLLSSGPAYASR